MVVILLGISVVTILFFSCYFPLSFVLCLKVFQIGTLDLDICILIDWMTLIFSGVLCTILGCVLRFSEVYMMDDIFKARFTWLVFRFALSMFCLIYIPHFFFLLVGWDGLGVTRFLLIIYYLRDSSWAAGMKTYLINRLGDRFFILSLILFMKKGYWDIKKTVKKDLLCLVIVLGCFTKSAQFPFSRWLPAAMAAPTPVSALVHSSTLVTAGVYIMIRFCHKFPFWLFMIIGVCGMWTYLSARFAACCEFDAKKVVAFSTLSQLGLMIISISLCLPHIAFFHLITHAMFKALMFICIGYLMIKRGHFQDIRKLGGLINSKPLVGIRLMVRRLSLMGFPFLAGSFSKELILEKNITRFNFIYQLLLIFSLPLTSYYARRLCFRVMKGSNSLIKKDKNINIISILPLFLGAIIRGVLMSTLYMSLSCVFVCHLMKFMIVLLLSIGIILSWYDIQLKTKRLLWFFSSICFLVPLNGTYKVNKNINLGGKIFNLLDQGLFSKGILNLDFRRNSARQNLHLIFKFFLFPYPTYYIFVRLGFIICRGVILF